jgi:anti-anti-sigma regulatory factor
VPITVLQVSGNLTGSTYRAFEAQARELIEGGTRYLLLDLGDVGYISSAGLRSLHYISSLLPEYRRPGGDAPQESGSASGPKSPYLKLLSPSQRALQALQLVGFDDFFEIYYDRQEAVESFQHQ